MKKIGGLFLALLTFFGSSINVLADAIEEVVEEKTQTIDKKDYESFKDELEKKVFNLNKEEDGYVYDYEISILEEKDEVVVTETKKVSSEKKFGTKEEAQKYYDEYKLEDSWKKGELSIVSESEDIEINGKEITITCKEATCSEEIAALEAGLKENEKLEVISKDTKKVGQDRKTVVYSVDGKEQLLHYEDALKIYATLNPAIDGYTIIDKEIVLVKDAIIDTKTFKDIVGQNEFETYEEAKEAADKFLANDDYEDKVAVVVAIYDESEKTTDVKTSIPFISEELAWAALIADATAELERAIEEGKISVESKINEIKKALEDAAKTGKLGLATMELDGKIIYYSLPEQHIDEISQDVKDVYDTEEKAQEALATAQELAELAASKIEGARVEFENVEIVKNNTAVLDKTLDLPSLDVTLGENLTQDNTYYTITNGDNVVVWTKNELDSIVKTGIEASLKETNENVKVTFISGYNNDTLVDGVGKIRFNNEPKQITIPGDCYSTIFGQVCLPDITQDIMDYSVIITDAVAGNTFATGTIKTGETWTLSYTLHTVIETWTYDKTTINYGFDYRVEGGGATITRSLHQVQSIIAKDLYEYSMRHQTISSDVKYLYTAQFDVYKEELKTNATVAYKITRTEAATGSTGPVEDEEDKKEEITTPEEDKTDEEIVVTPEEDNEGTGEVLPPQTGTTYNFYLEGALLISILVAAIALKKLCK